MHNVLSTIRDIIYSEFNNAINDIIRELKKELEAQGHRAKGTLIDTINFKITEEDAAGFTATIFANDYWVYLENGVTANRIPYTPSNGRRRGGKSKYIQGLLDWAATVRPELNEKERKGFVFAVANKHSKEGMPTRGSYSFSRNGRRTNFVQQIIDNHVDNILAKMAGGKLAERILSEIIKG